MTQDSERTEQNIEKTRQSLEKIALKAREIKDLLLPAQKRIRKTSVELPKITILNKLLMFDTFSLARRRFC